MLFPFHQANSTTWSACRLRATRTRSSTERRASSSVRCTSVWHASTSLPDRRSRRSWSPASNVRPPTTPGTIAWPPARTFSVRSVSSVQSIRSRRRTKNPRRIQEEIAIKARLNAGCSWVGVFRAIPLMMIWSTARSVRPPSTRGASVRTRVKCLQRVPTTVQIAVLESSCNTVTSFGSRRSRSDGGRVSSFSYGQLNFNFDY